MRQHPLVQKYFEDLLKPIRSKTLKEQTALEIEDHLYSAIEELCGKEISEEQAIQLTLSSLGDPAVLGRRIARANRPWFLNPWWVTSWLTMSLVSLLIGSSMILTWQMIQNSKMEQNLEDRIWAAYLEDLQVVAKEDFFKLSLRKSDAGEYLNSKINIGFPKDNIPYEISLSFQAVKVLSERSAIKSWVDKTDQIDFSKLDFSWMAQLHHYDHWKVYGSIQELERFEFHPGNLPIPDWHELMMWGKLRLLYGLKKGDELQALKDVRQLARLVYSQNMFYTQLNSLALLELENKYVDFLVSKKINLNWSPIRLDLLTRARRVLYAAPTWLSSVSGSDSKYAQIMSLEQSIGVCAAFNEVALESYASRALFKGSVLSTQKYLRRFERWEQDMKRFDSRCNLQQAYYAMSRSFDPKNVIEPSDFHNFLNRFHQIPLLREDIGLRFLHYARPNWSGVYQTLLAQKQDETI